MSVSPGLPSRPTAEIEEVVMAKEMMKELEQRSPIITVHASATSKASPEDVYEILADPSTHLDWAGKQAPNKAFKLLSFDVANGRAPVGTTFASSASTRQHA